jgi:hypothetical protein
MAGLHIAERLKTKLWAVVFTLSCDGRHYEADMVAGVQTLHDLTCEPVLAFGQHDREPIRASPPLALRKLIDPVAGFLAEEPRQPKVCRPQRMKDYQLSRGRNLESVV